MKMYCYVSAKEFIVESVTSLLNEFLNTDCTHLVYPIFKTNLSALLNATLSRFVSCDLNSSQYSLIANNKVLFSLINFMVLLGRCFAFEFKLNTSRPRNDRHSEDSIFKYVSMNECFYTLTQLSLNIDSQMEHKSDLVMAIAWQAIT